MIQYFNYPLVEHHTNVANNYLYTYSFALHPEELQPSGSMNTSRLDIERFNLSFNHPIKESLWDVSPSSDSYYDIPDTDFIKLIDMVSDVLGHYLYPISMIYLDMENIGYHKEIEWNQIYNMLISYLF